MTITVSAEWQVNPSFLPLHCYTNINHQYKLIYINLILFFFDN